MDTKCKYCTVAMSADADSACGHCTVALQLDHLITQLQAGLAQVQKTRDLLALLDQPTDGLELSTRARNLCRNRGLIYIGQLVQCAEMELLKTTNFGRKSVKEIRELLAEHGLTLGMRLPGWRPPKTDG